MISTGRLQCATRNGEIDNSGFTRCEFRINCILTNKSTARNGKIYRRGVKRRNCGNTGTGGFNFAGLLR